MTDQRVENVLQGLRALRSQPLSIIRLSEPITAAVATAGAGIAEEGNGNGLGDTGFGQRNSDASSNYENNPTPVSLEADLVHYKELFTKLRFSYLEQVTKEKFLRSIVGDPPLIIIDPTENFALESHLASTKQILQARKKDVLKGMVQELDARARDLCRRYETIQLQVELLETLPEQIVGLRESIDGLRAERRSRSRIGSRKRRRVGGVDGRVQGFVGDEEEQQVQEEGEEEDEEDEDERSEMNLPLDATKELVDEKRDQLSEVDAQLKALRQALPRQTRTLEQQERESKTLEVERTKVVNAAREAMERKRAGGGIDEVEMKARWLKGVETGMKRMLEIEV